MQVLFAVLCLLVCRDSVVGAINVSQKSQRRGRVFSLFNVVQFQNAGCTSTQTSTRTVNRFGTCYTASQCISKQGGRAAGSCASGFGVCCVFTFTADSSIISENCSYIQNPGFPIAFTPNQDAATTLDYTINKADSSVCLLRLDFETLMLQGETTRVCQDSLRISLPNNPTPIPTICGDNSGQHMYLDIGSAPRSTADLSMNLAAVTGSRSWDIKVTQIPCGSVGAPPEDCLQYYTGKTGTVMVFSDDNGLLHGLDYSACIRQEKGFCCVQYMQCDNAATSFNLKAVIGAIDAQHDAGCIPADPDQKQATTLGIPGSSAFCAPSTNDNLVSLYCGTKLSTVTGATEAMPICDCNAPFRLDVDITANALVDLTGTGVCITWKQLPCN